MDTRSPFTIQQLRQIDEKLAEMEVQADKILAVMTAGLGQTDPLTIRAGELAGAVLRFRRTLAGLDKDKTPIANE